MLGQALTKLEYENLMAALYLGLDAQVSILNLYRALTFYLDTTQEQRRGLTLGETVLKRLELYPEEKLAGEIGFEFAGIIDDIAKRQLSLKQYAQAEASYKKALTTLLVNKKYDEKTIKHGSAPVYHQLGMVAQEQREWKQAEQYYQEALRICVEYQDRYSQARTYGQLGILAREQQRWLEARGYLLQALEIYISYKDTHNGEITLRNLALVWQATGASDLPAVVAPIVGWTAEEVEKWFREYLTAREKTDKGENG